MICKRAFTLIEVLISLLVLGGTLAFFLPAIKGTTSPYRTLRIEGTCHYLADEYFTTTLLKLLSEEPSPEIETFSKEIVAKVDHVDYIIKVQLQPDDEEEEENKDKHFVILQVIVMPPWEQKKELKDQRGATRETKLCITKQQQQEVSKTIGR